MNKEWNWRKKVNIPEVLLQGDVFDRYDDETNILDPGCSVKLDEHGFYLVWKPKGKDAGILDMTQVWEARPSGTIKEGRVLYELEQRGKCGLAGETLEERTVWLTYGLDLVIVNGMFLIARTAQVAREWRSAINEFIRGNKFRHACPMHCLQKHWHSICLATNDRNRIPLRNIVRTFASGKPEKMVHKCLADLGLSGDKFIRRGRRGSSASASARQQDYRLKRGFLVRKISSFYRCGEAERYGGTRRRKKKVIRRRGDVRVIGRELALRFLHAFSSRPQFDDPILCRNGKTLDAGLFTFEKFLRLYHKICPRTEVQELFVRLSGQKEYLTRDHESYIAQGKMSGDGFLRFLLSDENSPVFLDRNELYQDMEQPLCHYFINSSHNTYLTGRQYGGKSSTEVYRQVLLSGCRCIELDCWDGTGENKGEPIITHGKAMCTDVFFKEVLYQIKETAFARSDFPVILSFENHCSKSNQLKMAKYCLEIFGEMLLIKPLDEHPLEPGVALPSPNRLRRKILIKNKRLKKEEERRQMEALSQGRLLDEEDPSEDQPTQPTSTAVDNSGEDCSGEQQAMSPRVMHGSPDYELSLSFDLAEDPTLAVHCPVSSPRTAPVSRCGDTGDASSSRRASMGPLSQVILPMALGPESSCSSRNCSPRNSFVFSPISAPLSSCSGPTDLRHSFLFSAFHPELRRSKRRRELADSFGNRVTAAKELLRAALHSHGEAAARSPSPGGRSQQQREKKDSITSDQRAHPEAEDDLRGGDAPASAIPSHLCCSSHPPAKPRLGPTASSASFHANEFVPSAVSPIVHRASLSNTSSRQNSTVALGSSTQHLPGTLTPPALFGDDCAGSVELNKASTLMSKIKQPLGLTRKVQQRSSDTFANQLSELPPNGAVGNDLCRQRLEGGPGDGSASSMVSGHRSEKRSFRHPSVVQSTTAHSTAAALLDAPQPSKRSNVLERVARAGAAMSGGSGSKKAWTEERLWLPALTKEEEEERLFRLVSDQEEVQESYHYQGATTNIHPLLSSLINYTHPVKFSGFDVAEQNDLHFHMSSFSESTGLGLLKQSALEFVNYNKRQLSRIYPKGARVDSSNFLPQIFWNVGCQLVALNFQTPDVCMQLNVGKFEYNSQCGYLLKPDFMRRPDRTFDPFSESPVDGVIAAHCSVRIISGQFLCERKTGTYVEVEMYGLPTDTIRKEHRTKLVPANGLNPIYNEEPFVFRKVILPELAVLRFAVYDENGKQLGQRILPLDGLQSGYRHISLRTEHNQAMALPTLFVHLQLKTYVPDEFSGFVDALADPRAYLSAQEKREKALQQMCKEELDIVEEIVPNQSQQQQISVGRRDRPVLDGVPFDSNTSIRRLQNGGSAGGRDQQGNTTAILNASNAQSPVPGCKDAAQSSRVQVDGQTETKFQHRLRRALVSSCCTVSPEQMLEEQRSAVVEFVPDAPLLRSCDTVVAIALAPSRLSSRVLAGKDTPAPPRRALSTLVRSTVYDFEKSKCRKLSASMRPDLGRSSGGIQSPQNRHAVCSRLGPSMIGVGMGSIIIERQIEQVEWINIADLRREKLFLKLQKKLAKEWVEMKNKHQKSRENVQKQQQSSVDRLVKRNHLNSTSLGERNTEAGPSCRHPSLAGRVSDPAQNAAVVLTEEQQMMRSLVQTQTDEWSQLLRRHEQEEFEQHKGQILQENAMLKDLLISRQQQQMATLRAKFTAESKELIQTQTKKNMLDKQAIQQDRNAKTNAEKDRRKKELNEKNLKQFMEERKRLGTKCGRHEEQLIKKHKEQSEQLEKEAAKALELEEMSHRESLLASQPQCIV
ncbi:PLC-beta C terminal [Globodera pallida]|nr:PLC-beta C terminal [Globodera pallida]